MQSTQAIVHFISVCVVGGAVVGGSMLACAPSLTLEGSRVQVAPDADAIASCQPISAVESVGSSPEEAETVLRNKAGMMAATTVHIGDRSEHDGKYLFTGKAYTCKEESVAPAEQ